MTASSPNEAIIREAVRAQLMAMELDKVIGHPTSTDLQTVTTQVAKMAASIKTTKFGGRHGFLALVLSTPEYQRVTGKAALNTTRLVQPPTMPTG